MAGQNDDSPSFCAGKFFQPFAQVNLFAHEQVVAKPADLAKCRRLTKNKCAGEQFPGAAQAIPKLHCKTRDGMMLVKPDRAAARDAAA